MAGLNIHVADRICSAGVGIVVMRPRVSSFPDKPADYCSNPHSTHTHTHTDLGWHILKRVTHTLG